MAPISKLRSSKTTTSPVLFWERDIRDPAISLKQPTPSTARLLRYPNLGVTDGVADLRTEGLQSLPKSANSADPEPSSLKYENSRSVLDRQEDCELCCRITCTIKAHLQDKQDIFRTEVAIRNPHPYEYRLDRTVNPYLHARSGQGKDHSDSTTDFLLPLKAYNACKCVFPIAVQQGASVQPCDPTESAAEALSAPHLRAVEVVLMYDTTCHLRRVGFWDRRYIQAGGKTQWLRHCRLGHKALVCNPEMEERLVNRPSKRYEDPMPRDFRLVDTSARRFIQTAAPLDYAALSYRWAEPLHGGEIVLTKENETHL
ncbi:putative Heterokaryon incompatibility domain-containing protein [Seiridium cardinale]